MLLQCHARKDIICVDPDWVFWDVNCLYYCTVQRITFEESLLSTKSVKNTWHKICNVICSFHVTICIWFVVIYALTSFSQINFHNSILKELKGLSASYLYQHPQMYSIKGGGFLVSSWRARMPSCPCLCSHRSRTVAPFICKAANPILGYSDTPAMTAYNLWTEDDKVPVM